MEQKPSLLKPYKQVIDSSREASYALFARSIILYPPDHKTLPVLVVSALYQEIPIEMTSYESRVVSQQNHLSVQMSELFGIRDFSGWQVIGITQMDAVYVGEVDAVLLDDTLGVVNMTFKRSIASTKKVNSGGYLS